LLVIPAREELYILTVQNNGDSIRRQILIAEDDPQMRSTLERCLIREGFQVTSAADGEEAIRILDTLRPELVITDLEMPRSDGRKVVAAAVRQRIPVAVLTARATVEIAVELMRAGAANFLTKPFTTETLRNLLNDTFGRAPAASGVVGEEPALHEVLDIVASIADTTATVLLNGESGTGKEVIARTIHRASGRRQAAFVAVNCGAIPEPLLESELFGHARGAFTGATHARAGRFALADGGTLFLDEIGDMPLSFQVKLLRVVQEGTYEVVGESTPRTVDVRIIAATHRDLAAMVQEGTFRQDLYYRLNVIEVRLPALRERSGDIPLLVEHFVAVANERHGTHVEGAEPALLEAMARHRWPGNVRELSNVVERMVLFQKRGLLLASALPASVARAEPVDAAGAPSLPAGGIDLRAALTQYEDSLIDQALKHTGGNRNAAAQFLGLNRTTLVEKLNRRKPTV
jgi:DNA-binding NtrC family response regulator